jgi:hypothetical protein
LFAVTENELVALQLLKGVKHKALCVMNTQLWDKQDGGLRSGARQLLCSR